jgi:hypothetical protein
VWSGLNNGTMIALNPSNGRGKMPLPVAPPHPPQPGNPTLLPVISKPLTRSELQSSNSFVFRKDSAGFGIPRGELGQLNKFSEHTASKGTASTTVYLSAGASSGESGFRPSSTGVGTMHRGSPPPPRESNSSAYSAGSGSFGNGSSRGAAPANSNSSVGMRPSSPAPAPSGGGSKPH